MANGFPVRNMGRMQQNAQRTAAAAHRPAEPEPSPVPPRSAPSAPPPQGILHGLLPDGLHPDRDTLLLLGLILLLRREHPDQKLLLALLYIML